MSTGREASIERRRSLSKGKGTSDPGGAHQATRRPQSGEAAVVGRSASIERRRKLSSGKAAIGVTVPVGEPKGGASEAKPSAPALAEPKPAPTPVAARPITSASGRGASIERRRQLSAGKTAIPGADMETSAGLKSGDGSVAAGREASRIRRGQLSAGKAAITGKAGPAPAANDQPAPKAEVADASATQDDSRWAAVGRQGSAPLTPGRPGYPLKVVSSKTNSGQQTTGLRIGPGGQVTGHEHGATLPVTGNQYYGEESGAQVRARPTKVGATRTAGGLTVSGTMVRSRVEITGDERGNAIGITGEADQSLDDDLTPRSASMGGAQFPRRTDPHGHTAVASEFLAGRSGRPSRRSAADPRETTQKGYAVSGTAVGRSDLMTGDEDGAYRKITGTQYVAKKKAATAAPALEAPAQGGRSVRRDPVTGAKVVEAQTWGGQRVTGPAFEHVSLVTGSEAGSYIATTGTPYQGPGSVAAFLGEEAVPSAAERVIRQPAREAVTGDTPLNNDFVTGTQRGANRDITGTPYYREQDQNAVAGDAIAEIDHAFTIASPQRKAQLRAKAHRDETQAGEHITGSFASGHDKVTGAVEFNFTPRRSGDAGEPKVTGEGGSAKNRITGDSWAKQSNVTGTEGYIAAGRNPTIRGPKAQRFAGASKFRHADRNDIDNDVTGILTDREDAALRETPARVTVSGGATT